MSMGGSQIEPSRVLLPILSSALGKMVTDRALNSRLTVVRIKDVKQWRSNAD